MEVKASRNIGPHDLSGLGSFKDYYGKRAKRMIAYLGNHPQQFGEIEALPFLQAVQRLAA